MVGCVAATPDIADGSVRTVFWVLVIIAYTAYRTVLPIDDRPTLRRQLQLTFEAALMGIAAASTGYFDSPFAFSTLTAISVAGLRVRLRHRHPPRRRHLPGHRAPDGDRERHPC